MEKIQYGSQGKPEALKQETRSRDRMSFGPVEFSPLTAFASDNGGIL
jgi:hypothetical protein